MAKRKKPANSVAIGDYGPVYIRAYYDDDDGKRAIVYLGAPLFSPYLIVPFSKLRKRTPPVRGEEGPRHGRPGGDGAAPKHRA